MNKTAGFLLFNEVEELDFVGPWEIFSLWKKNFGGPSQVITLSESAGVIECAKGLQVISSFDFSSCPPLDYLIIPGGFGTRAQVNNNDLINFIREAAKNCEAILSICTGAFLLQAAGLLDGKKATTHWQSLDRLRAFPKTTVIEERIVHDGKIWTSAGISAGIDLALAFIDKISGDDIAGQIQLHAEYYPLNKNYGNASILEKAPRYLKHNSL